ncbi:MAG: IS66 family transposase, partial [Thermoanaerobaculia bacterium]
MDLAEWNGAVADLLAPITTTIWTEQILPGAWIQTDDPALDVQQPGTAAGVRQGHLWVTAACRACRARWSTTSPGVATATGHCGGWPSTAGMCRRTRRRPTTDLFLRHPAVIEVGCRAHARRYFKEAAPSAALPCAQVLA